MSLLRLENISVNYGEMEVLREVSLEVYDGSITSLVGANGAGKSTLLSAISGLINCRKGSIIFDDEVIDKLSADQRVEIGLIQIPEGRHIFPYMSTKENLEMGSMCGRSRKKRRENFDMVMQMFPVLYERAKQIANTLSGGEQQMLAIGRGLMANPRILMLDEPSLGLAPILAQEIFAVLSNINKDKISVLLVEQDVKTSLEIANWGYVLENGRIVLSGEAKEILENDQIRKAYLGL